MKTKAFAIMAAVMMLVVAGIAVVEVSDKSDATTIAGTVKVSCGLYLIPIVTIIFAFIALGEKITPAGAIGAVITIAGLFISER